MGAIRVRETYLRGDRLLFSISDTLLGGASGPGSAKVRRACLLVRFACSCGFVDRRAACSCGLLARVDFFLVRFAFSCGLVLLLLLLARA